MQALEKTIGRRELDQLTGDLGTFGIAVGNRENDLQLNLLNESELPKETPSARGEFPAKRRLQVPGRLSSLSRLNLLVTQ